MRRGQLTFAAQLWHQLARLGDPRAAAEGPAPLVTSLDAPFNAVAADCEGARSPAVYVRTCG